MSKLLRIIAVVFFLSVGFFAGVLNILRATVNKANLQVFEDKVIDKQISYSTSLKGYPSYHLELQLANRKEKVGISYFSEKDAYADSTFYLIDTGKVYKFYLDKTFPISNDLNCGINKIQYNNIEIFTKPHKMELYFGIFFILLSASLTFVAIKFGKWKTS